VLHAARWKCRTQNSKKSPSARHRKNLSGYIFATKACIDNRKKLLNTKMSSRCPHNMANFGPLTAEIGWRVCSIPANFNGFRVLALLLQRCRSPEANQTLHELLPPNGILPGANLTFRPSLAFSYIRSYYTSLNQWTSAKFCGVVQGMELRNYIRLGGHHVGHRPTF